MKKIIALAMMACAFCNVVVAQEPIDVMTFNIRVATHVDGYNQWDLRKGYVAETLRFYSPDLLGMQEVTKPQLDYLVAALPQYGSVGVGREDGVSGGEHMSLFYRRDRFEPVDTGNF